MCTLHFQHHVHEHISDVHPNLYGHPNVNMQHTLKPLLCMLAHAVRCDTQTVCTTTVELDPIMTFSAPQHTCVPP